MRLFLVLALVGAALAFPAVSTRDNCPPAGYTAISGSWKLDNLPPHGKYAICLTPEQVMAAENEVDFTWTGVFRLTQSVLLVDNTIRIRAQYPTRVDWNGVTARGIPEDPPTQWRGLQVEGAPGDVHYTQTYYWKNKKFGNCGTLNKVDIEDVTQSDNLKMLNCSAATKLNEISIYSANAENDVVDLEDCRQLIFTDLTVVGGDQNAVEVQRSEAAFIRPFLASEEPDTTSTNAAFQVTDGSNITVCDSLLKGNHHFEIGSDDESDDGPSSVALAGRYNSHFPEDLNFDDQGGVLFTLKKCPSKFASGYEMKLWQKWWTVGVAEGA